MRLAINSINYHLFCRLESLPKELLESAVSLETESKLMINLSLTFDFNLEPKTVSIIEKQILLTNKIEIKNIKLTNRKSRDQV